MGVHSNRCLFPFGLLQMQALLVFILCVRCTAINPADPGIMSKFDPEFMKEAREEHELVANGLKRKFDEVSNGTHSCPLSASQISPARAESYKKGPVESVRSNIQIPSPRGSFCHYFGGIFCAIFVLEDCRKQDEALEQEGTGEDALFCTLCNAEVRKHSKHCRSCDKCVDGFDHHCRWLNNCVGRKNYVTFISLMATSLVWLVVEAGVGIGVLVRCFVNKNHVEAEIVDRLGNGFSRAPFATVVAICTAVSMLACVPLVELFFFHMILIRKGITTYEYVVAMRAMSEEAPARASVDEELPNVLYSPSGSVTTGFSAASSLGLQYKGAWCTPPRVFVDYQEEVAPQLGPGMVPSTVDPDANGLDDKANKGQKRDVRISAWKLAKLDSNEAMKAAAKARASSSVLRPVDNRRLPDSELSSSDTASIRSSVSIETGGNKDAKNEFGLYPLRNSFAPSQGSRDEYGSGAQSLSSLSSPSHVRESVTLTPLPQAHGFKPLTNASSVPYPVTDPPVFSSAAVGSKNNPVFHNSSGFDENIMKMHSNTDPLLLSAPADRATSLIRDVRRTSVVWDQEAGRYVTVPIPASEAQKRPSLPAEVRNPNLETGSQDKRPDVLRQEPLQPLPKPAIHQSEKLMYTGESIFFGGPLLSGPLRDGLESGWDSSSRAGQDKLPMILPQESRFKRDAVTNQLPIFRPGYTDLNLPSGKGPK